MQSLEIWSFHEAFADINAFVNVTSSDLIVEKMFEETSGNLKKSSLASRIGEDLASSISKDRLFLRDLSDQLIYINPDKIDLNSSVTKDPHNFGRIFSCSWYAILVEIFNFEVSNGVQPLLAFKTAKDECYNCLIKTIMIAPCHKDFFNILSKIFLLNIKEKYKEIVQEIFENRKLIKVQIKYLSNNPLVLSKKDCVIKNKNNEMFVLKDVNSKTEYKHYHQTNQRWTFLSIHFYMLKTIK